MVDLLSTPILVTIILGVVGLTIPAIDAGRREKGLDRNKLYSAIAFGALAVAMGIVIFRIFTGEVLPAVAFGSEVLVDDLFGSFFAIALLLVSLMITASSWNYWKGRSNPAAYYSLILLSSIGMILIAYSTDLVMLLVAWELMSLPTYALAGFQKRDPVSNEAAIKYFMFGALSSALIVFAIGLVYGMTGTTNIGDSIHAMTTLDPSLMPVGLLAVALFVAGFGFKMGLVPFHMWLPDAYEGSPATIGGLLAAATKKAGFAAALRVVVLGMFALNADWTLTLAILAVFTMTIGNLGAIMQRSVPRMLAYSSIAQAGYIMIGIALAPYSDQALSGSLFHIINHAVMKSAGFIAIAAVAITLASYSLEKYPRPWSQDADHCHYIIDIAPRARRRAAAQRVLEQADALWSRSQRRPGGRVGPVARHSRRPEQRALAWLLCVDNEKDVHGGRAGHEQGKGAQGDTRGADIRRGVHGGVWHLARTPHRLCVAGCA